LQFIGPYPVVVRPAGLPDCNPFATRWSKRIVDKPCGISGCNLPAAVPIAINLDPRLPGMRGPDGKAIWRQEVTPCRRHAFRNFGIPLDYPIPEDGSPIELWPEPEWSDFE
jgi:hypothetical protein